MINILFLFLYYLTTSAQPERVISLSPAITEIIFELNLQKKLVGTVDFSDFPEEAKKIPRVGGYNKPLIEKILQLKPDLVLIPREGVDQISTKLKDLQINFNIIDIKSLKDVGLSFKQISIALGDSSAGKLLENKWVKSVSALEKKYRALKNKNFKSVIVVQTTPLIVAASNTFLNEIIEFCGGENIYKNLQGYPRIQQESILSKKIEKVFLFEHFADPTQKSNSQENWTKYTPHVFVMDPNISTRPGPRLLSVIEIVCQSMGNK